MIYPATKQARNEPTHEVILTQYLSCSYLSTYVASTTSLSLPVATNTVGNRCSPPHRSHTLFFYCSCLLCTLFRLCRRRRPEGRAPAPCSRLPGSVVRMETPDQVPCQAWLPCHRRGLSWLRSDCKRIRRLVCADSVRLQIRSTLTRALSWPAHGIGFARRAARVWHEVCLHPPGRSP